ncbi:hypothetical protein MaudMau93_005418 [Microsporum audouinii]
MVYPGDRQALGARLEASALSPIKICLYPHEAFLALMADGARIIPWALQKEKQYGLARVWQPANIVDELPPCKRTATPPAGRGPTDPDALPFTPALHPRGSPGAPFSPQSLLASLAVTGSPRMNNQPQGSEGGIHHAVHRLSSHPAGKLRVVGSSKTENSNPASFQ